jgi:hypothetical protein
MILDTVLRLEASIEELKSMTVCNEWLNIPRSNIMADDESQTMSSGAHVRADIQANSTSPVSTVTPRSQDARHHPGGCTNRDPTESAVLSSGHLSSAESLLKWTVFLNHPSILEETESPFLSLEYGRSPFQSKVYAIFPSVGLSEVKRMVSIFQRTYNFWFPTMSLEDLKSVESRIYQEHLEPNCQSCLALLVMALGCVGASAIDEGSTSGNDSQQLKLQGASWFTAAMKMLHFAHIEMSVEGCQCLLLTGYGVFF